MLTSFCAILWLCTRGRLKYFYLIPYNQQFHGKYSSQYLYFVPFTPKLFFLTSICYTPELHCKINSDSSPPKKRDDKVIKRPAKNGLLPKIQGNFVFRYALTIKFFRLFWWIGGGDESLFLPFLRLFWWWIYRFQGFSAWPLPATTEHCPRLRLSSRNRISHFAYDHGRIILIMKKKNSLTKLGISL